MLFKSFVVPVAALMLSAAAPVQSVGDLLVAPTRIILTAGTGGEVVVSNKSDQPATYRISLVLRRMDAQGQLLPVDEANATQGDATALDIINYAPRKIDLGPQEAQTIRIGVRVPPTLPPGEYRAHLLFRAVPATVPAATAPAAGPPPGDGMSISLTPIYGVTVPVIIRVGEVPGAASLENARWETGAQPRLRVDLVRSGKRSIYGRLDVLGSGSKEVIAAIGGIAVYPEVERRTVSVALSPEMAAKVRGPVTVRFTETDPSAPGATSQIEVQPAG